MHVSAAWIKAELPRLRPCDKLRLESDCSPKFCGNGGLPRLDDPPFPFLKDFASQRILLQFCVLRLGLLQDGDIGVGVVPQCQKVLVFRLRFDDIALHSIGSTQLQVS